MIPPKASIIVDKVLLALYVAAAAMVGLAPVTRFLGSPRLCFLFAAEGAIVSAIYLLARHDRAPTLHRPGILETVLRGIAAICFWAFLGVLWFIVYGMLYWFARLFGLLIGSFDSSSIAFYGSLVLAFLFGIGVAVVIAQGTIRRLYSSKVSSRSAVYQKALQEQTRTLIYAVLSVAALLFMFFCLYRFSNGRGVAFYVALQLIPYIGCSWVLNLGVRIKQDYDVVSAFGGLLEIADYKVIYSPHSSDPSCDAVLSGLDLIAVKDRVAFAIEVKNPNSSTLPVDWTTGSRLVLKASALQLEDLRHKIEIASLLDAEIRPLLVLVGRQQDQSLIDFAKVQNLLVMTVDATDLAEIVSTDNRTLAKEIAEKYFKLLEGARKPVGATQQLAY